MTTTDETTSATRHDVDSQPVTFPRVLRAEWVKLTTLRSSWAVLGAAVVGMFVIGLLVAYNTRTLSSRLDANDLVPSATLQGYYLGQLLLGALGVIFVSGEYGTGMIRATLAAVPRRLPVLTAKATVLTVVALVTMVPASVLAFLAAEGFLAGYRPGYSLGDPGVLRVVLGTGIYLTLVTLIGSAVGWIVRSTPGALVAFLGLILVVPVLVGNVLGSAGKHIAEFLPSVAGAAFASSTPDGLSLSPWTGIGVMAVWVVGLLAVAAVLLRRRDA